MTSNNIILSQPEANSNVDYMIQEKGSASLSFTPDDISALHVGNNGELIISFDNGGQVTITNFEDFASDGNVISLADGTVIDPSILTTSPQAPQVFTDLAAASGADANPIVITQPEANTTQEVSMAPGQKYICDFDPANAATVEVKDGQMVLTFADGSQVVINNYETAMAGDLPAELTVADATAVAPETLLTEVTEIAEPIEEILELAQVEVVEPAQEVLEIAQESVAEEVANVEPAAGEDDLAEALANIETAAGEEGGTTGNSGYGFNSTAVDVPLGSPDAIGPLGATNLAYQAPQFTQETPILRSVDDSPTITFDQNTIDETTLDDGNIVVTGSIDATYGNDGPGAITTTGVAEVVCPFGSNELTSSGNPVTITSTSDGYVGTVGGETVFTFVIDPVSGDYTFTQLQQIDHPDSTDPNDELCLNLGIKATDSDGDRTFSNVRIIILDDGPVVLSQTDGVVDETNFDNGPLVHTDTFQADMGQDTGGSYAGNNTFSATGSVDNGALTSNGEAVTVTFDADTNTYTGVANGETVFTLELDPTTAEYTYTQFGPLDHADASDPDDILNLNFGVDVIDFDGDTDSGTITIRVHDDAPVTGDDSNTIDETNLDAPIVINDSVSVDFGSDGQGSLQPSGSFTSTGSVANGQLTSNGVAVVVTQTANGYVGVAGGETIFTLEINSETGEYTFTLNDNLDHADGSDANDIISLNFGTIISDYDGDTDPGQITINIKDDAPTANDDCQMLDADGNAEGNVVTGLNGGDGAADSSSEGMTITSISFGDTTVEVPATGTTTIEGDHGVLTISSDGSYTYELNEGEENLTITTESFDPSSSDVTGTQSSISDNGITIRSNSGQDLAWFSDTNLGSGVGITGGAAGSEKVYGAGEELEVLFDNAVSTATFSIGDMGDNNLGQEFSYEVHLADGTVIQETVTIDASSINNGIFTFDVSGYDSDITQVDLVGGPSYVLNGVTGTTVEANEIQDEFDYTITDNDGDTSTATLKLVGEPSDDVNPIEISGTGVTDDTNLADGPDVENGVINVNYQGDGPGTTTGNGDFNTSGNLTNNELTSNGKPITVTFDANTNTYTGTSVLTNFTTGETFPSTAFTMVIHDDGTYTFTQNEPLDHSNTDANNERLYLKFGVTATDSDGDTGQGTVTIAVKDDAPEANDDAVNISNDSTTAEGNVLTNDDNGADAVGSNGIVTHITFNGVTIVLSPDGTEASIDGTDDAIETVSINGEYGTLIISEDGSYSYTRNDNEGGTDVFTYTMQDADGDSDTATLKINVADDLSPIKISGTGETDDTNLADGPDVENGVINVNYQGDGPGTTTGNGDFNTSGNLTGGTLSSGGVAIAVTFDAATNTYTGAAGDTIAFTMVIHDDGTYTFTQNEPLDHSNTDANNERLYLKFGVTATDSDGDTGQGTVTIAVKDDAPIVAQNDLSDIDQDQTTATGNVLTNDKTGQDGPAAVTQVEFADSIVLVPETGTVDVQGVFGTLTIASDGSYTYVRNGNEGGEDEFTYTLRDSDGDLDSANLLIQVRPDVAPIEISGTGVTDDTNLADGPDVENGVINVNYQGDGPGTTTGNGDFNTSGNLTGGTLSSGGVAIAVTFDAATNTYTGAAGDAIAFTMVIHDDGTYTFTQNEPLDHSNTDANNERLFLKFGVTATDSDGDTGQGTVTIAVKDDAPEAHDDTGSTGHIETSETHCFDPTSSDVAGTQNSITQDGITLTASNGGDLAWFSDAHLGSGVGIAGGSANTNKVYGDGEALNLSFKHATDSVTLSIGDMGSNNIGNVFSYTVHLTDGSTVEETVTINGARVNNGVFEFDVSGYNSEISSIDLTGGPSFVLNGVKTEHHEIESTNAKGNVLANDDLSLDDSTLVTSIRVDGQNHAVTNAGTTIQTENGILTIAANGKYTYEATNNADTTNVFTYTITDADGDTSTAQLSIDSKGICTVDHAPTFTVELPVLDTNNDKPVDDYNYQFKGRGQSFDFTIQVTSGADTLDSFTIEIPDVLSEFGVGFNKGTETSDGVWNIDAKDTSGLQITFPTLEAVDGFIWKNPNYETPQGSHDFTVTANATLGNCDHGSNTVSVEANVKVVILSSPLVLDLDGDGVELLNIENGVQFDMDQDGEVEQTGWVGADDGLLALDKNGDGIINNRSELFGNSDEHTDGFDNLAKYDSNSDGVIDKNDDIYDDLTVWKDTNTDGVSDANEMLSLMDVGVVSIFLNADMPEDLIIEGSWISHTSTFLTDTGETHDIVDAWFETTELSGTELGAIEEAADTLLTLNAIGDDALDVSQMLETGDEVTEAIQDFVHNTGASEADTFSNDNGTDAQDAGLAITTTELDDLPQSGSGDQIII